MKPVEFLTTKQSVDVALDMLLERRQQFAVVQDEFSGTSGILTMEDVLETLWAKKSSTSLMKSMICGTRS